MTEQYCFLSCCLSVSIDIDIEIFIWFCLYFLLIVHVHGNKRYVVKCYFSTTNNKFYKITLKRGVTVTSIYYNSDISWHLLSPLCRLLSQPWRALQDLNVFSRSGNFYILIYFCLWVLRLPGISTAGNSQWLFLTFVLVVAVIILGSFVVRLAWRSWGAALRAPQLCSLLLSTGGRRSCENEISFSPWC